MKLKSGINSNKGGDRDMSGAVVEKIQNSLLHRLETLSLLPFGIHICELKHIATTPFIPTVN